MRWISFKLAYDLNRLLYNIWFFECKMTKIYKVSTLYDKVKKYSNFVQWKRVTRSHLVQIIAEKLTNSLIFSLAFRNQGTHWCLGVS